MRRFGKSGRHVTDQSFAANSRIEAINRARFGRDDNFEITDQKRNGEDETEKTMMNSILTCSSSGWLMIATSVVLYSAAGLAIFSLIKGLSTRSPQITTNTSN